MSKYHPNIINAHQLASAKKCGWPMASVDGKHWSLSRPISAPSVVDRLRLAWSVFIGRYDALDWALPLHAVASAEKEVRDDQ